MNGGPGVGVNGRPATHLLHLSEIYDLIVTLHCMKLLFGLIYPDLYF